MRAAAAVGLLVAAAPSAYAQLSTCNWKTMGTTYDLSSMTVNAAVSSYDVKDMRDANTQYYFNVCGGVAPPPTTPANQCQTSGRSGNAFAAPAWQVTSNSGRPDDCYRLGSSNVSLGWNFTLFDPAYPARGVVLSYSGGDTQWCTGPRFFALEVVCALVQPSVLAYQSASVREENQCSYAVQLPSIAGCPLECRAAGDSQLCSGHGVCGFNSDAQLSQCYCYNGWGGALCGAAVSSSSGLGVEGIMLIVVCVALAGVIGAVSFMLLKLRRLNVNPAAYAELQGKYNELGQMA